MSTDFNEIIKLEKAHLTDKKEHTRHKIQYVREYVKQWLFVACNRENDNINFIDCMSNAGIYLDGELCTAVEVLNIFCDFAKSNTEKQFNVLFNDIDTDKIRIAKQICDLVCPTLPKNVHTFFDAKDVNNYLSSIKSSYNIFDYPSMTIMYVDPFDFRTVHIPTLKNYILHSYCEVIFNLFTSDFVRNGTDAGITKSLGGNYTFADKQELWEFISRELTVGKMKYCLSYPFRNRNNTELYQIMFITPSDKGLDKLKQAIWNTFNGQDYYRTVETSQAQLSLFSTEDDKEYRAKQYGAEAFELIKAKFGNKTVTYQQLSEFILARSILMSSQIISYILKPYIAQGKIIKKNLGNKSNYTKDSYYIQGTL